MQGGDPTGTGRGGQSVGGYASTLCSYSPRLLVGSL